jgi:hypothetical protein
MVPRGSVNASSAPLPRALDSAALQSAPAAAAANQEVQWQQEYDGARERDEDRPGDTGKRDPNRELANKKTAAQSARDADAEICHETDTTAHDQRRQPPDQKPGREPNQQNG